MRWVCLCLLLLSGCDVLFPELSGKPPTADAGSDAGGMPHISGAVCALTDVRDVRNCTLGPGGSFRLAVEETHDATQADAAGTFTLPTTGALASATLSVVDATGAYVPTITVVHPTGGVLDSFAVPLVSTSAQQMMAYAGGFTVDPTRGAVLAWLVNANAVPVAGVRAAKVTGAVGPLYDGASPGELTPSQATGSKGLVALFDLPPGTLTLQLTTSTGPASFSLPVRAGAFTLMALTLP